MEHSQDARAPALAMRTASVARDLDAIFLNRRNTPLPTSKITTVKARRRRWFIPTIIGVAVLVMVGAVIGAVLFMGGMPLSRSTAAAAAAPRKGVAAPAKAVIPRLPVKTIHIAQATPGKTSADPLVMSSPADSTAPTPPSTPTPTPTSRRKTERRGETAVVRTSSVAERTPVSPVNCDELQDDERARCMRPSVLAAHHQLLTTYNAARRAGVDSGALTRIQRRWTKLQRRANDRPDDTLDGYRDLRLQLLDLIDDQRSAGSDW